MKRILSMVLVTMMIVISTSTMVAFAEVGTPVWTGTTLSWGADATATSYTVNLYNTGYLVKTVNVADATSYDFASDMKDYGSYFATVTPAGGTASAYSASNVVGTNLAASATTKINDAQAATAITNALDGNIETSVYTTLCNNDTEKGIRFELCDSDHLATVKSFAIAMHANVGYRYADAYYSVDGAVWTKADATKAEKKTTGVAATTIYTLNTPVSCRWIKLVCTNGGAKTTILEVAVYGDVAAHVPLDSIKMDGADLTEFSSNQTSYSVDLIEGATIPTISATTAVEGATVNVTQATTENPVATITSTKGEAVMTYTVNFNIIPAWKYYNLAQGKDSSMSTGTYYNPASNALDGDIATMAQPKTTTGNAGVIVVDMGNSVTIGSVGIVEYTNTNIFSVVKMYYSDTAEDGSWTELALERDYLNSSLAKVMIGTKEQTLRLNICELGEVKARYFKLDIGTTAIQELLLYPVQDFSYSASLGALTEGTKPSAVFTATNDKIYDVTPQCKCIFAIYKDGALFDVVTQNVSKNTVTALTSEEIASVTATKDVPADGNITAKGFIWADFGTMVPLAQVQ